MKTQLEEERDLREKLKQQPKEKEGDIQEKKVKKNH